MPQPAQSASSQAPSSGGWKLGQTLSTHSSRLCLASSQTCLPSAAYQSQRTMVEASMAHSGRSVLITGAGSGIGRHLAITLAKQGCRITVCPRLGSSCC